MRSVGIPGVALLLALGCGGRYRIDGDLAAGAGRASVGPEGGAPNLSASGAGNVPSAAGAPSVGASSGGAPSAGAPSAGAPSAGAPSAGAPSGGAPSGGAPGACQSSNDAPNGKPVYAPDAQGFANCSGVSVAGLIMQAQQRNPTLAGINGLYQPNQNLGVSFVYAFEASDGNFELVFRHGLADCASGCSSIDYTYYRTSEGCQLDLVGQYQQRLGQTCVDPLARPRWGIPIADNPNTLCNTSPKPQDLTGEYELVTCGQAAACTQAGIPAVIQTLNAIGLTVSQHLTDLSHGTVTLHHTGELLLDERPFAADFTGRSFKVELNGPLSTVCSQEYDLSFSYDFDGFGPRTLNLDFERSPKCSGNNGSEDCRGNVHALFGDATMVLVK